MIVCAALGLAAVTVWVKTGGGPEAEPAWQQAAVWLSCDAGSGNGVLLWAEDGVYVLATAAHVTGQAPENLSVCGMQVRESACCVSAEYDLAFVKFRLPDRESSVLPQQTVRPDEAGYEALKDGDEIRLFGFLGGQGKIYTGSVLNRWIYMEDFGYHMLWGEMGQMHSGLSGSGVFDGSGRLIGILCGGGGQDEIAVLPANIIVAEWERMAPMRLP